MAFFGEYPQLPVAEFVVDTDTILVLHGGKVTQVTRSELLYKFWEPKGLVVFGGTVGVDGYFWNTAYPNGNVYITMDKRDPIGDASHVFCCAGRAKWEVGVTTEDTLTSPVRWHIKAVRNPTADAKDDIFKDVMIGDYDTETMWVVTALGIGGVPSWNRDDFTGNKLHIMHISNAADNPYRTQRLTATIENYNNSGGGGQSAAMVFKGYTAGGWIMGNDFGLNGLDNFFIGPYAGGIRVFVNTYGVAINGSTLEASEGFRIDGLRGFLGPRLTTTERDALGTALNTGLMIFNTTAARYEWWDGVAVAWKGMGDAGGGGAGYLSTGGGTLTGGITFNFTGVVINAGVAHGAYSGGTITTYAREGATVHENLVAAATGEGVHHNDFRARGTIAAPADTANGDVLARWQGFNYKGGYRNASTIALTEDWSTGGNIQFATHSGSTYDWRWVIQGVGHILPWADNVYNIGASSNRAANVYSAGGVITTSDARTKTEVVPLTDAEIAASKVLAREIGTFRFLDAVRDKGAGARQHIGMTVQRAIEVMESHGLDPFAYGFICHDTWDAREEIAHDHPAGEDEVGDDGQVVRRGMPARREVVRPARAAGDRYSFRTDELLLFLARGFDARLAALEAV